MRNKERVTERLKDLEDQQGWSGNRHTYRRNCFFFPETLKILVEKQCEYTSPNRRQPNCYSLYLPFLAEALGRRAKGN
jgi:hypothetical protein